MMRNKIITAFFCLLICCGVLVSALLPDRYFSEREKRRLTQFPAFVWNDIVCGKYGSALEKYLSDQFPGRDGWVSLQTVTQLAFGMRKVRGVYIADDGYLIDAFVSYDAGQLERNAEQLKKLSDTAKALQVPVSVLLVPSTAEILSDKLPAFAPHADQKAIVDVLRNHGLAVVDPTGLMKAHADEYLYYRTDHHYTSLGAWYCYNAWREHRGLEPDDASLWTREELCSNFFGTTWNKTSLAWIQPDVITGWYQHPEHPVLYNRTDRADSIYERKHLEGKDPYAVFLNSNQPLTVIKGSGKSGKLLLIKDSYGNTFAQFPAEEFSEVHVIDLRFFRENVTEYMEQNGITDVLVLYGTQNFVSDNNIFF